MHRPLVHSHRGSARLAWCRRHAISRTAPKLASPLAAVSGNGSNSACPTAAETARTVLELTSEGVLATLTDGGAPLGTPVPYTLAVDGQPRITLAAESMEAANLLRDPRTSLLVHATTYPARGVASVALQGSALLEAASDTEHSIGISTFKLEVDSCVYYGRLDPGANTVFSGDEYRAAEPDILRHAATELINTWNTDRAEDIYRIVSHFMDVPLAEMLYAELLWVDRLGLYIRAELLDQSPCVVRVPFYRPVLDERDARSVMTMAAQLAWEKERNYNPPTPSSMLDAAAAAASQ